MQNNKIALLVTLKLLILIFPLLLHHCSDISSKVSCVDIAQVLYRVYLLESD